MQVEVCDSCLEYDDRRARLSLVQVQTVYRLEDGTLDKGRPGWRQDEWCDACIDERFQHGEFSTTEEGRWFQGQKKGTYTTTYTLVADDYWTRRDREGKPQSPPAWLTEDLQPVA